MRELMIISVKNRIIMQVLTFGTLLFLTLICFIPLLRCVLQIP